MFNAVEGRNLVKTKKLKGKESVTYTLKLWLDQSVTLEDDIINKEFIAKVSVVGEIAPEINRLMEIGYDSKAAFWEYKKKITKIIFENQLNPKNTELSWDVSAAKDEKIMSYLIKNDKAAETEEDTYTLYIHGNNGIEASPNSKYLFFNFSILESIEGLEYLDTSQVTNMASMFYGCNNLQSLDISSFDTSNVTSMSSMFSYCNSLKSLDTH